MVVEDSFVQVDGDAVQVNFHEGQWQAITSERRFIIVIAGTQGGKTSFGPWWLRQEMGLKGPGDYMVITPTYPLLNLKALPEFLRVFKTILRLGHMRKVDRTFEISPAGELAIWGERQEKQTRIIFGYATDPDSLESATALAAWLDEAGQDKFKLGSYEAIMRRLSLAEGRLLVTTTIYNLGWLKQKFWDRRDDPDIELVRFASTMNPQFPPDEMERARRDLPGWKFDMFYRAIFTRPAGMIFSCYDEELHVVDPFVIPSHWARYMGQDYGGVNTAAVFLAHDEEADIYYLYAEYWEGDLTAAEHVEKWRGIESLPVLAYGGSNSEKQWRREFAAAGMRVNKPLVPEIEVGIDRVFAGIKNDKFRIFRTCEKTRDQLMTYSRVLDENNEPTIKILDKETYHLVDGLRYIGTKIWDVIKESKAPKQPMQKSKWSSNGDSWDRWGDLNAT